MNGKAGRPKTKVNTGRKIQKPKVKLRLDERTVVYVRSKEIAEEIWRPLYPKLEIIK